MVTAVAKDKLALCVYVFLASLHSDEHDKQYLWTRQKLKVLCTDAQRIRESYGQYVVPEETSVDDIAALRATLQGVKSVVCVGAIGGVAKVAADQGVEHIVLISSAGAAVSFILCLGCLQPQETVFLMIIQLCSCCKELVTCPASIALGTLSHKS